MAAKAGPGPQGRARLCRAGLLPLAYAESLGIGFTTFPVSPAFILWSHNGPRQAGTMAK